ncbi:CinA family protein [Marivibrio halodurans]|uniref:CinA family protein n=1 Tax=Marivibrio halodurans TaxID=2039722 RepID=A0A8J7RYR2_9PROT|nr:CinA family protein [Marivibrio halodurans]MBP5855568.1 CinA family protein [Marivibrio halodurans]
MFSKAIRNKAENLLEICATRGLMLATAESCTGGLIAGALTAVPGSSRVVERGFVTYTNAAKHELLGVPLPLFDSVGAVSEAVARAMAEGALNAAPVGIALSVTGIAGPGGSERKPAGLVYIGCALAGMETTVRRFTFEGDRDSVREQSVEAALALALTRLADD